MKLALEGGAKRPKRWAAALVGAGLASFTLVLYLKTLAPTVLYYERPDMLDPAMLQAEASVLGVGHPTGYPTYMMVTHLFTYLPVGDAAYRINLASAVYGAAAVAVVYLIGLRLSKRVVAAAAGALAFGVGATFWSQAVIAEVYTLNALFIALSILTLLVWRDRRENRYLLLSALLMGLSLTHHLSSGLLIPAGLAFVFLVDRHKLRENGLPPKMLGFFLAGLTPYLYLPIRAVMEAPLNEADPSSPGRFLLLVTGGNYLLPPPELETECNPSPLMLEDFPTRLQLFGGHLLGQFPAVLVLVGVLGILYMLFTDRAAAVLLGTLFLGCLLHVLVYLNSGVEDFYVFLIPAYLAFGLWISAGLGLLLRSAENLTIPTALKGFLLVALSILALAAPIVGMRETYGAVDHSRDYKGRQTVEAVARNAKPNATVLHHRSSLWYMVLVEQRRRDLTLIDPFCTSWVRYNDLVWPDPLSAAESAARYDTGDPTGVGTAQQAAKTGPVYILGQEFDQGRAYAHHFREAGFDVVPVEKGLLYELVPPQGQ